MTPAAGTIAEAKRRLRQEMREVRAALAPDEKAGAERLACESLLRDVDLEADAAVAGYWPLAAEFDLRPALLALAARGHPIGLPVVRGRGQPLQFRRWTPGIALEPAAFGVSVPPPQAPELEPAVVLAPLLAFDAQGYRLGYGGGYYDLTLAALRRRTPAVRVGALAFARQERASLPHDGFDQRLDWVVTEAGVRCLAAARESAS